VKRACGCRQWTSKRFSVGSNITRFIGDLKPRVERDKFTQMKVLNFLELRSREALPYAEQIGALRIKVFADFPYLYSGDLTYELEYLQNYFSSDKSFIVLAMDGDRAVGASTAVWLPHAETEFRQPFVTQKIKSESVCYFGESVLLDEYRGLGVGKRFMNSRESFARSLPGVTTAAFCAVIRPDTHPMKPKDYRSLHDFWRKAGFVPRDGMVAYFSWKDLGEKGLETEKRLQFWLKELAGDKK
jgi:GNAT superfamily N-acetyltransferase